MAREDRSGVSLVLLTAIVALVSAVVGAFIGGYFQLRAQEIASQQAQTVAYAEASRSLELDYAKLAANYLADLGQYRALAGSSRASSPAAAAVSERLQRETLELVMKSDQETGAKVLDANLYVSELVASEGRSTDQTAGVDPVEAVIGALFSQSSDYRSGALPSSGSSQLNEFVQAAKVLGLGSE